MRNLGVKEILCVMDLIIAIKVVMCKILDNIDDVPIMGCYYTIVVIMIDV